MHKETLRKQMLEKRKKLSYEEAERKSRIIIGKLKKDEDYIKAKTVMFYVSKGKEVMTHDMIKEAMKDKKVIVPKITGSGMHCCQLDDFSSMKFGCFGVLEPADEVICDPSEIDLIIVPGVVFDSGGDRIGRGKGYYDSMLKKAKAKKIGLAYDFQLVDRIPKDEWDVGVDKVISG